MTAPAEWAPQRGTRVWLRVPGEGWRRGTVAAAAPAPGAPLRVALDCPHLGEGAGPEASAEPGELEPANPALLDGVSDLTHLSYLNEPGILHVLRGRYSGDGIYTTAGPVLVAVNPFKPVGGLYSADAARAYSQRGAGDDGLDPHVFLTADRAFKQMVAFGQSQSVLITGESGAGKTETTKIVMRFLAGLAGGTGMEDRVLETNPLLEAFGNAKTIHNNNSSRFGKLIEIYFNRGHAICGALIHTYLLEKSRVAHQQPGERSYHVFYQLVRGAGPEERERLLLPAAPEDFAYLAGSGCTAIAGVDDAAEFARVRAAMAAVGIGAEQQGGVWALLSAILWLGNVRFVALHDDAAGVDPEAMPALRRAAALLAVGEGALVGALTTRRMLAGGEEIVRELNLEAALDARDALAKALYAALFRWLVARVNAALAVGRATSETTLSILDIYGFECFQENSFEQLCINFANERLQQQFSKHMFRLEQEVYEAEGIDWAHVEFVDNQDCVDLIEARPPAGVGILSLLDEECMMPRGTDSTFAAKLQQQHAAHPRFAYNARAPGDDFTVQHYAGLVSYSAAKFLDKNRDTLSKDLVALLQGSRAPLVAELGGELEAGAERRGSQTVGARFRDQLRDLMQRLDATALHFVRCIKPNSQQEAGRFDAGLVLHQLRCCGVLEVARIARAGYPTRYLHSEFAARYKALLPELGPGPLPPGVSVLDVCRQVLAHFGVDPSQFQIGRTRLFFRAGVLGHLEDAAARMQRAALLIQSTWRMARCRRAFLRARRAATAVQAHWRGGCARLRYAELRRQHAAAVAIQAAARGAAARRRYRRALQGVLAIQMAWRRHMVQGRVAARVVERRQREEGLRAVAEAKRRQDETFEAIQRDFGVGAGEIRRVLGLWQEHGEAVLAWVEQGCPQPGQAPSSQGGDEAAPAPPASDDSGLLLEAAAANADTQAMQQRLEGLQGYCHQLERSADDLREENQLLHRSLHHLQEAVLRSGDPAAIAHCQAVLASLGAEGRQRGAAAAAAGAQGSLLPADASAHLELSAGKPPRPPRSPQLSHISLGGSEGSIAAAAASAAAAGGRQVVASGEDDDDRSDTISLMSLNDGDSFTTADAPGGSSAAAGLSPTASSLLAARHESAAVVGMLGRELAKKQALFDDDADFIREVRTGAADAPGMDPDAELQRLVARYREWKKQFKERLGTTHKVLRQLHKEEKRAQRITGLAASLPGAGGTPLARRPSGTGSAGSAGHRLSSPSARSPAAVSPSVRGLGLPPAPAAVSPSSSMGPSRTSSHDGRTVSLFSRVVGRRG